MDTYDVEAKNVYVSDGDHLFYIVTPIIHTIMSVNLVVDRNRVICVYIP